MIPNYDTATCHGVALHELKENLHPHSGAQGLHGNEAPE